MPRVVRLIDIVGVTSARILTRYHVVENT
jgi:hypothetical protein